MHQSPGKEKGWEGGRGREGRKGERVEREGGKERRGREIKEEWRGKGRKGDINLSGTLRLLGSSWGAVKT